MVPPLPDRSCFIDGAWCSRERLLSVRCPATGDLVGEVPNMGASECRRAIDGAARAFPGWRATPAEIRAAILRTIADAMRSRRTELARILTREQGKPLAEAEREILYGASFFEWYGEEAKRIYGEIVPASSSTTRIMVLREPVGVVAMITPWNFPVAMIARKAAAALATGCCCIVRPASQTPFSALMIAQIAQAAGLPSGALSVITGDAQPIADAIMESHTVRAISFTGSTEVGQNLMRAASADIKRITLELGGNAPFIVCEDADIGRAVEGAIFAKYRNAGQTCICVNRFLVHSSIIEQFTTALVDRSMKLRVGCGLDTGVEVGPLISLEAVAKVRALIDDALQKGAKRHCGNIPDASCFVTPFVLSKVNQSMRLTQEEIFGPVCVVQSFSDDGEAIALANDTKYGLASYLYTGSLDRAVRIAEALEFGMIGINTGSLSCAQAPFGGVKHSGFGREGGRQGLDEFLNYKYLALGVMAS